ncbi:MAG TPA: hypothetical protein EYQ74_11620 [Planctomycetes bacterium]|nr:hypothetical protein [Planctomycetota bacterium]HIK61864.1 hypothetical protein [Planctomycetota bacterium]
MSMLASQSTPSRSVQAVAVSALLALASCALPNEIPEQRGAQVAVLAGAGLEEMSPGDVAVAPVVIHMEDESQRHRDAVPQWGLRKAMQRALVRRRYSPLSLDFVDSTVVNASYAAGDVGEQAVCEIIVHDWSERYWATERRLDVDVEVRMVDPAAVAGSTPLWAARMDDVVRLGSITNYRSEEALRAAILNEIALELMARMPARNLTPGQN